MQKTSTRFIPHNVLGISTVVITGSNHLTRATQSGATMCSNKRLRMGGLDHMEEMDMLPPGPDSVSGLYHWAQFDTQLICYGSTFLPRPCTLQYIQAP